MAGYISTRYLSHLMVNLLSRVHKYSGSVEGSRERVIIIGSGRTAEHVAKVLEHPSNVKKYQVVGIIDDDFRIQGMNIYGKKVLGRVKDYETLAKEYQVGMIFLASHLLDVDQETCISEFCSKNQIIAVVIPDIFGSIQQLAENGNGHPEEIDASPLQYACHRCGAKSSSIEIDIRF
jgi:FlaA1/EpsC-like NDP-sugar epimerase